MRRAVVAVVGLAVASGWMTRAAHAECAMPRPVVAPNTGTEVPPDPVIYVFAPSWFANELELAVTANGAPVDYQVVELSRTDAFVAYAVKTKTGNARELEVTVDGTSPARYSIDRAWRANRDFVSVQAATYEREEWTCSRTDAHFLTVSPAVAYRVETAPSAAAFDAGEVDVVVFPHHLDDFWQWDGAPGVAAGDFGKIGLGYLNCMGESAPSGPDHRVRHVRVTALYADGIPGPEWEASLNIDEHEVHQPRIPVSPVICQFQPYVPSVPETPLAYIALAGLLLGFAAVRAWLRRASARHLAVVAHLRVAVAPIGFVVYAVGAICLAASASATATAAPATGIGFVIAAATWSTLAGAALAIARHRPR